MNASPHSSLIERCEVVTPSEERPCKIVFFWEDFDAAIHARKAFDSVVDHFGSGRPVDASTWSFSMLESPEFNASVLMDASRADVIVVAARGDEEVPERVVSWLEICTMRHHGPAPVIVALHEERLSDDRDAAPFCSSLKEIAGKHGAGFACSKDLKTYPACRLSERTARQHLLRTIGTEDPVSFAGSGVHRWCGLND